MALNPSGEQYAIAHGDQHAVLTEVGAALRVYAVDGLDVISGFPVDQPASRGRGQQLLPWPNRIRDGRYVFDGHDQQLALSEPARQNASHGLARWVPWTLLRHDASEVVQQVRVYPQPGWPGLVEATVTHRLDDDGLTVEVRAVNRGAAAAPFGYAAHPYLTVGESAVDEIELTVPAARYLDVDDRLLPVGLLPVDGTVYDLRAGRLLGDALLDTAMTDLGRESDGRWRVRLTCRDRQVALWAGPSFGWVQVFTGGPYRDGGVAVEPMTCGPDAFNGGPAAQGLLILAPGEEISASWGLQVGDRSRV